MILTLLVLVSCNMADAQLNPTLWTSQVPMAVRSPYFNSWMKTSNAPLLNAAGTLSVRAPEVWPGFWNNVRGDMTAVIITVFDLTLMQAILGWAGHIRVDNTTTYKWLGQSGFPTSGLELPVLNNIQVTPTQTIMTITAGPIDLTVTYLSPIEVRFFHCSGDIRIEFFPFLL